MGIRSNTGGEKEFYYTKEDLKEIESEDTEYTADFKKGLKGWYAQQEVQKTRRGRRNTLIVWITIIIVLLCVFLYVLRSLGWYPFG